jgi:hypothetical protein
MARLWVLDTSTKGTGATMVPLESTLAKPAPVPARPFVPPKPAPRPPKPPAPRRPPEFKVVDVLSDEVLVEGAGARETLEMLGGLRSAVDVRIYVRRAEAQAWRLLTLAEQRALWDRRRSEPARA